MLDNVKLFNECLENPAKNVDPITRETLNKVIINNKSFNELQRHNAELLKLINLYKKCKEDNDVSNNKKILEKIDECLKYEGMNYCPYSQYFMVYDVTYKMYLEKLTLEEKEIILNSYLEDRHELYSSINYSDIIFQVLNDNYSHKRKGKVGVRKLERIFREYNISRITSEDQITDKLYYILPDSGDEKLFNKILEENHIKFKFKVAKNDKKPDALIKIDNSFLIVEHKILKESGGGQDKQLTEIIDFVGQDERGVNYISFMDGILFNEFNTQKKKNKLTTEKNNIVGNLKRCPYNYFVNEYGFRKVIEFALENRE